MTVWIDADLCNGCKRCQKACPYGGVEMRDGKAHILDRCTSCGACIETCKPKAILTDAKPREIPDFTDRQGIWVFAEQRGGCVAFGLPGAFGESRGAVWNLEPGGVGCPDGQWGGISD